MRNMSVLKRKKQVGRRISQPIERTSAATSWYLGPPESSQFESSLDGSNRKSTPALPPSPRLLRSKGSNER